MRIVILEDNSDRREAMSAVLDDLFPNMAVTYFTTSREMIDHLISTGIYDVALISLDNDLDLLESADGTLVDAGDGLDVAKWLLTKPPVLPVVIHTTNTPVGSQMEDLFGADGWIHARVVPYDGESWIRERWRSIVRELVVSYAPSTTVSSVGVDVLRHGLRKAIPIDQVFGDLLQIAMVYSCGNSCSADLCFELVRFGEPENVASIVNSGSPLLSELLGGAPFLLLEESEAAFGVGPISASSGLLASDLRDYFAVQHRLREIQLDVVQPIPGHQAVLLTGNRSSELDLRSHEIQANIREVKSLIELGLLVILRDPLGNLDASQAPEVCSGNEKEWLPQFRSRKSTQNE